MIQSEVVRLYVRLRTDILSVSISDPGSKYIHLEQTKQGLNKSIHEAPHIKWKKKLNSIISKYLLYCTQIY